MTKVYILDNGSVASKLLQHERKDAQVVKVSGNDLVEQFTKFDPNNEGKIFLPFTVEELAANNEQLRKDIQKVEGLGFKNLIVLPYEGDNLKTVEYLAKQAGVKEEYKKPGEVLRGIEEDKDNKPYKTVRSREVQDLP